jgi:DNA-binding Lrp family transcriptional regulator
MGGVKGPKAVVEAFERLKRTYPFYIVLTSKNGHYYVYRHQGIYVKETRKVKSLRTYLGRITTSGEFLKRPALTDNDVEKARAIIIANGGEVIMPEENPVTSLEEEMKGSYERQILTMLSTNARIGVSEISKRIGLSYTATLNKIKKLEERYGIKYTIEYGFLDRFNLYRFFAVAKFTDNMPDAQEVKKLIEAEPRVQLALWAVGEYNLFLFMLASNPTEAEDMIYKLRSSPALCDYPSNWYSSYFTHGYGYIPLRDEFFELIKERVWRRTKETPRKQQGQIFYREYATMRELNSNGLADFSFIDKKYKLNKGSARYTYHDLIKNENLWRVTITMKNPPIKGVAVINLEQTDMGKFNSFRKEYLLHHLDENDTPLNRYLYSGDIGSPYGILFIIPVYKEGDLDTTLSTLTSVAKGVKSRVSIISSILVGNLGYRRVDKTKTTLYKKLSERKLLN